MENVYTLKEAAAYLEVSERTIKHYLATDQLHPLRRVGRSWLFTKDELDRCAALPRSKGGRPRKPKD